MLDRFLWFLHNTVSHPLMAILDLLGFEDAAVMVHDVTVPQESRLGEVSIDDARVIIMTEDEYMVGLLFTELYALSGGKLGVNRHPFVSEVDGEDHIMWVVSHEVDGEWVQDRSEDIEDALKSAKARHVS